MRTGRPRRQGRLIIIIECRGGSEPTRLRMKGCARGFVAHRMQCEARVVVRVFFSPQVPLFYPRPSKAAK